jgi:hypothetical protein
LAISLLTLLSGCGSQSNIVLPPPTPTITSTVTPSINGIPNSIASLGSFEFISVQGTGQIFTYNIATGSQVQVGQPYVTPCANPSGMLLTTIAAANIMAVVCFDTNSLLTLTIHPDGTLTSLGSVNGLPMPYPGIALDGTNVLVPLFGQVGAANGAVAKVSIATPAIPTITGTASLASPATGQFVNPGYLTVAGGYIYVAAGSENAPLETSSTIQVINEVAMTLVGPPFTVAHSPQSIAVQGTTAYVTLFDATQLQSIDITNPAALKPLQTVSLPTQKQSCHALPLAIRGTSAYIGCYDEGIIEQFNITNPSAMQLTQTIPGLTSPQRLLFSGQYLLVPASNPGGHIYQIKMTP